MKKRGVLYGLMAIVLGIGGAFAGESSALENGYKFDLSKPCEYIGQCNNVPNAPICTLNGQTAYQLGGTDCSVPLRNWQ